MKKNKVIRYIGSKEKLINFISHIILDSNKDNKNIKTFIDGFTGSGVVSKYFFENSKWDIIACDISKYSEVFVKTINVSIDPEKLKSLLEEIDSLPLIKNGDIFNEFSFGGIPKTVNDLSIFENQEVNSRLFFSKKVGQKIDTVRKFIKYSNLTDEESNIIKLFLLNYADKNANTTSVFGAYLKRNLKQKEINFIDQDLLLEISYRSNNYSSKKIKFIQGDIIESIKKFPKNSIIYFDPPYNTRRYESNYHILNYIIDLEFDPINKIKDNSKTGLPNDPIVNLFSSVKETKNIFKKMIIQSLFNNNKLFISYNNEGIMSKDDILNICKENNFSLLEHKQLYKKFTSGESVVEGKKTQVEEIIWEITKNG